MDRIVFALDMLLFSTLASNKTIFRSKKHTSLFVLPNNKLEPCHYLLNVSHVKYSSSLKVFIASTLFFFPSLFWNIFSASLYWPSIIPELPPTRDPSSPPGKKKCCINFFFLNILEGWSRFVMKPQWGSIRRKHYGRRQHLSQMKEVLF